jgi:hypothetical protein
VKRLVSIYLAIALVLAGCAGSAGEVVDGEPFASAPDDGGAAASAEPEDEEEDEEPVNPDDPLGFGEEANTAVVVIGDQRYEFADLYCVTIGGALGAASVGGDPQVDIDVPPEDWETSDEDWDAPSVRISGDDPYLDLRAGGEVVEMDARMEDGQSQVDGFTTDGHRASGTATFIDYQAFTTDQSPDPISGTFEVTCDS